jgi:hypothetical protein
MTRFAADLFNRDSQSRLPHDAGSVYFVRNGAIVDQTNVDRDGRFRIAGLRVGDYTFAFAGPNGVAAFGVSVMPPATDATSREPAEPKLHSVSSIRLVQQAAADLLNEDLQIDTSDLHDVSSQNMFGETGEGPCEPCPCPVAMGNAVRGGTCAGGGLGGGDLGLLGLGGLAGLAALGNNNNPPNGNPSNGPMASTGTMH